MAFQLIVLAAVVALGSAGIIHPNYHGTPAIDAATAYHGALDIHQVPNIHSYQEDHIVEHHEPAHYNFNYNVHDLHTGDIKNQHESRVGDKVEGSYSLVEPDGSTRIVDYHADHHTGFHATVRKEHAPAPIHAPTPVHAPVPAHHDFPAFHSFH